MRFHELPLPGAYLIELEPHSDERGFFARCFAEEEFSERGLVTRFPHCNLSRNAQRGTLRGMHYAVAPSAEAKVVRCVSGAIYDVIVDLRATERTFGMWSHTELTAENGRAVYVPADFAHGFLTLTDDTDVFYQMGDVFRPETARGFRWDDETFHIAWPAEPRVISPRDAGYADFQQQEPARRD
jgi:dTDP-4-dehydrorhamnose 3,5-epimerase